MGPVIGALVVGGFATFFGVKVANAFQETQKLIDTVKKPAVTAVAILGILKSLCSEGPNSSESSVAIQKAKSSEEEIDTAEMKRQEALERWGINSWTDYNVAFCGKVKVGKSTLLNVLLGKNDTDEGAAKVGRTQCTKTPCSYPHPDFSHVKIWDLPGSGTIDVPSATYFDHYFLAAFDCIIIVFSEMEETDHHLVDAIVNAGKPLALVRCKADEAWSSMICQGDIMLGAEISLEQAKETFESEVKGEIDRQYENKGTSKCPCPVFVISAQNFRYLTRSQALSNKNLNLQKWHKHPGEWTELMKFIRKCVEQRQ